MSLYDPLWPYVPSTASVPYGPLLPLRPFYPLYGPFIPSRILCPLYGPLSLYSPLSSLWPSVSSVAICLPLKPSVPSLALGPPLRYSVLSMVCVSSTVFCHLFSHLYPLWPCSLYSPRSSLCLSVSSTALSPPYCPLSPPKPLSLLWPSVPSKALCPL